MERINSYIQKVLLSLSMLLLGVVFLVPSATKACTITVKVTNPSGANSNAHITKLKVKVKGGTWRNIQEGGKRILSPGQTYTEKFKPTIGTEDCDARRRYSVNVKCKKSGALLGSEIVYKDRIYEPSETGWTRNQDVTIDVGCP